MGLPDEYAEARDWVVNSLSWVAPSVAMCLGDALIHGFFAVGLLIKRTSTSLRPPFA